MSLLRPRHAVVICAAEKETVMELRPREMNGKDPVIHLNKLGNGDQFDLVVGTGQVLIGLVKVLIATENTSEIQVSYRLPVDYLRNDSSPLQI